MAVPVHNWIEVDGPVSPCAKEQARNISPHVHSMVLTEHFNMNYR